MTDRGKGFYRTVTGTITPEYEEALKEHEPQQTEEPQQEEEEQEPPERPPRQQPSLRGETSGLVVPRGKAVGSKAEILSYSLVHQAALILLGILSNTSTYRTRCWVPVSSYALVGLGMWCTHWLGHRKIIPGWFEFHVMGATNAFALFLSCLVLSCLEPFFAPNLKKRQFTKTGSGKTQIGKS